MKLKTHASTGPRSGNSSKKRNKFLGRHDTHVLMLTRGEQRFIFDPKRLLEIGSCTGLNPGVADAENRLVEVLRAHINARASVHRSISIKRMPNNTKEGRLHIAAISYNSADLPELLAEALRLTGVELDKYTTGYNLITIVPYSPRLHCHEIAQSAISSDQRVRTGAIIDAVELAERDRDLLLLIGTESPYPAEGWQIAGDRLAYLDNVREQTNVQLLRFLAGFIGNLDTFGVLVDEDDMLFGSIPLDSLGKHAVLDRYDTVRLAALARLEELGESITSGEQKDQLDDDVRAKEFAKKLERALVALVQ